MHVQTHLMAGWCAANLLPLGPRERLFCMVASVVPDVDGLGKLVSEDAYQRYHHVLGHNLTLGVAVALGLALLSTRRPLLTGLACLGLFHLHLLMDYYGSGLGWNISYWWPWRLGRGYDWICAGWEFDSWQNKAAGALALAFTILIAWRCRRTPLEAIVPSWDRQVVKVIAGPGR